MAYDPFGNMTDNEIICTCIVRAIILILILIIIAIIGGVIDGFAACN